MLAVMTAPASIPELIELLLSRHRKGTERWLAEELGVRANTVNAWRRGLRRPPVESCQKLADYSGFPLDEVMRMAGRIQGRAAPSDDPPWLTSLLPLLRKLDEREARVVDDLAQHLLELREPKAPPQDSQE